MQDKQEVKRAMAAVVAVAEAIREAGRIPAGTLCAALLGKMDIAAFERLVQILKNTGLVEERSHELIWIGPKMEGGAR